MNLRLNKLKKKSLIYATLAVCLLIFLSSLIPLLRVPVLNTLEYPFILLSFIKREVKGIIFYHRNFVQNERLEKEIDFLRQRLNAAEETSLENKRLRELFSFKQTSPYKVVAARVIGRSADNWSSLIIIDKGRRNGIKSGMVVINYLGLIGRVMETTESTSKIMLINDSKFAVSAIVKRSRQEGLISGTLGSSLMMRYLPREADIEVSDTIITSGLTDLYPKGLLIGTVVDIGEELSGLACYAIIKPVVDLSNVEEVLIIAQ